MIMVLDRKKDVDLLLPNHGENEFPRSNDPANLFLGNRRLEDEAVSALQHGQELPSDTRSVRETPPASNSTNDINNILFTERLTIANRLERKSLYEAYPTTLSLILLAHLIFLYQWNKRKSSREVLVTYRTVVQKRQYHRAIVAVLSHPPSVDASPSASGETNDVGTSSFLQLPMGNGESVESPSASMVRLRRFLIFSFHRLQPILHPFLHGQLSGLPLLFYNSHILWSCRALEPSFESSWWYARVLLGLTVMGLLLELRVTHNLLRNIANLHSSYQAAGTSPARNVTQTQQILLGRGMGTLTVLSSGVLILFHSTFPYIPIQVLPFMDSTIRWWNPFMSYWFCICVLTTLSWKSHPVTSVLFGTLSGCLWSSGLTSFLGEFYWGSSMIIIVGLSCLLSIKVASSDPRRSDWLPCVDYVGWDRRGELRTETPTTTLAPNTRNRIMMTPIQEALIPRDDSSEDDDEEDDGEDGDDDVESRPLLPSSGRTFLEVPDARSNTNGDDVLHGRLPVIDMDDETMDTPASSNPSNSNVRSRRGAGNATDVMSGRQGRDR